MDDELKPCPFCGTTAEGVEHYPELCVCGNPKCPASSPEWDRTDWNTRPGEDMLRDELDAARRAEDDADRKVEAAHQMNSELNEQLRATRLELAAEVNRRRLVEAQKTALEGRLRAETRIRYGSQPQP